MLAEVFEEGGGEVALAGAGDDDDDEFAGVAGFLRDLEGGVDGGAGGDSYEEAFFFGETAGHGEGFVVGDLDDFVDEVGLEDLGMKPAPMPWILWGPGLPPERTGLSAGSTATVKKPGLRDLRYSLTPVRVPPVPTPETRMSAVPSVSFQISGPVVS